MTDELEDSLNFHRACMATCQQLYDFMGTSVQALVERKLTVLPYHQVCYTLLLRVRAWLQTLNKLDHPGDFQAVHAASRSVFETAIDLVLIYHQENRSVKKLVAWQHSTKLKYSKRLLEYGLDEAAEDFIRQNEARIQAERLETWGKDRRGRTIVPERWTGRSLKEDAVEAEKHLSGFVRFYLTRYSPSCWFVHGSGVTGLLEFPPERFPELCAMATKNTCDFALVCSEYALKLFDLYDPISEQRFKQLEEQMAITALTIWKQPGAARRSGAS